MKRNIGHITPRYIWDRSVRFVYERRHATNPWLRAASVEIIRDWLRPTDIALELGSGRSTFWFAQRVKHLTSVEHDQKWFRTVSENIRPIADKVTYVLAEQEDDYVAQVEKFSDGSIDFCLVDGMWRDRCANTAISKVKNGGLLVLDNAEWFLHSPRKTRSPANGTHADEPEWKEFATNIGDWRTIWTTDGTCDTALFFKP